MFKKILEWSGILALIVIVLLLIVSVSTGKKLGNSTASFQEADQGYYVGSTQVIGGITQGGFFQGSINQAFNGVSFANISNLQAGNFVQGLNGIQTYATTTTLTANQFCSGNSIVIIGPTATTTITFPTLAAVQASTIATGGCGPLVSGGFAQQYIYNSSTANVAYVTGVGMTFKYTLGVSSGAATSTTQVIIPPGAIDYMVGETVNPTTFFLYNTLYQ